MKYTVEVHANRMHRFVKQGDVFGKCPAGLGFEWGEKRTVFGEGFGEGSESICSICKEFLGIPINQEFCPCSYFEGHLDGKVSGCDQAIAAAHAALELWDAGQHPMQRGK